MEQIILLETECIGYRDHIPGICRGCEAVAVEGDQFIVDYVRVFDRVPEQL